MPHGPVVETLLELGFNVYSINLRQLDRLSFLARWCQGRQP
jgi:hypothetical protein